MFDKQKIIAMTTALEDFVRVRPNVFILPEVLSANLLSLLKRLKSNVVGILTNAPVVPEQNILSTPSGNYLFVTPQEILTKLNSQTGIIISAAKSAPNPICLPTFNIDDIKISIPAFALTDEEAMAIYDRLTTIETLKRYQEDGVFTNFMDSSIRFARGMSTLIDSRYQDVKVQVWDRRNFKIPSYDVDDAAIIMQGPIQYMDNYTITTAQLYREWYPNAPIIISTWKNEATDNFREECKKIGVVLLENELPSEQGALHVNYQIESSFKGVEYAKQNTSVKYALKCRTDQRINRADFLIYLINLLKIFPPNGDKINKRIIMFGADKYMAFFVCDFLYFGTIEDIKKLFNIPRQSDEKGIYFRRKERLFHYVRNKLYPFILYRKIGFTVQRKNINFNVMVNKFDPPETFILKNFCNKYIEPIEASRTVQIYWNFLRNYSIIIDTNDLLLDWPKYQAETTYVVHSSYHIQLGFDHVRWLDFCLNYKDDDG